MTEPNIGLRKIEIAVLAILFVVATFLRLPPRAFFDEASLHSLVRVHPQPAYNTLGFDEGLYAEYVDKAAKFGLTAYPIIVKDYVERQERLKRSILSPLRFLYIFAGYTWQGCFGGSARAALEDVSSLFSVLTLCLSAAFAWRLRGKEWG